MPVTCHFNSQFLADMSPASCNASMKSSVNWKPSHLLTWHITTLKGLIMNLTMSHKPILSPDMAVSLFQFVSGLFVPIVKSNCYLDNLGLHLQTYPLHHLLCNLNHACLLIFPVLMKSLLVNSASLSADTA